MNLSINNVVKEISDHQILLLLYLAKGCNIVTNEGASFRCWMQYSSEVCNDIEVRKNSANKLSYYGLMQPVDGPNQRLFYHAITEKGKRVLSMLESGRVRHLSSKIRVRDELTLGSDY